MQSYSATQIYDILYPEKLLTKAASQPELRHVAQRRPRLRPTICCAQRNEKWTDPKWLTAQLQDMDLRSESKLASPVQESAIVAKCPSGTPHEKSKQLQPVHLSEKAARQLEYMNRLTARFYAKRERRRATAAQLQRHALIDYEPMRSAIRRLGYVATTFKPGSFSGTYERALNSAVMTPTLLDQFLRQNFELALTPAELGCVIRWMDVDGDGAIDATEFLREFWKFGVVEHMRASKVRNCDKLRTAQNENSLRATWLARFASPKPVILSESYTLDDLATAEEALANAAADCENQSIYDRAVREIFDGPPIAPAELADIIWRNWSVRLTPAQVAAIYATHDVACNGVIDGNGFYRFFSALGRRERARRTRAAALENARRHKKVDQLQQRGRERFGHQREARVEWPESLKLKTIVREKNANSHMNALST